MTISTGYHVRITHVPSFRCEMRARGVLHEAEQDMALQQRQEEHYYYSLLLLC